MRIFDKMGTGKQRWGQFLVLIVLMSSFFYFILQVDIEEDLVIEADLHLGLQRSLQKSIMEPEQSLRKNDLGKQGSGPNLLFPNFLFQLKRMQ